MAMRGPAGGPAEVTHARVFRIAGPAMLANLTTPLLGLVATGVIGQLGEAHLLGAVAMSAVIFDFLFWLFGFLRMGTVALTAQALGAGNAVEQRAVLLRALLLAASIGLFLVLVQAPAAEAIYRLMGGSAAVTEAAKTYFFVRIWSAPFALCNYAILGWLIGLARVGVALALQVAINLLNIAATAAFVLAWDLGVAGAALGALIGEGVGLMGGLLVAGRLLGGRLGAPWPVLFDREKFVRMIAINRDIMIRTAALIAAFGFFTAQGARSGDVVLAANAVLNNIVLVGSFFLDGFATAAEQLCGYAIGSKDRAGFRNAVRLVLRWGFAFGVGASAVSLAGGAAFIELMTTSPEVRAAARQFLVFAALAPALGVLAYAFDGIYVGATWTRDMRNLMLIALAAYLLAWWVMLPLGNAGLWMAVLLFLALRGMLQAVRYPSLLKSTFPA
jgi:MATE family multidrug resistance protein